MGSGWVGWMGGRPHPGSPRAYQTRFGMSLTPLHPKDHDPSKYPWCIFRLRIIFHNELSISDRIVDWET